MSVPKKSLITAAMLAVSAFMILGAYQTSNAQETQNGVRHKIAGPILDLLNRFESLSSQEKAAQFSDSLQGLSNALLKVNAQGEVEVTLHAADHIGPNDEQDLLLLGATIQAVAVVPPPELNLPPFGMIDVLLPLDSLEAAAELPWVVAITPPGYADSDPHPTNPTNSEGVMLHSADLAQGFGVDGTGVTIGVISTGVSNLATAQASGELPAVTVFNSGNLDEGTAMLEIIHDMAPGAALLYDDGAGTSNSNITRHFNALINLFGNGANVIAEDLFFNSQPVFQQGLLAQTAELIAAAGVSIHSSAGNRAQNHASRVAAVGTGAGPDGVNGPFANCTVNPTNTVAIAPGGDTTFDLVLGANAANTFGSSFTLQWSEPRNLLPTLGQGGFTNLDLFVMDAGLNTCLGESSAVVQANGVGDTIETIAMPPGLAGTAVKVVVNVTGTSTAFAAPILDLRWVRTQGQIDTPAAPGSINPDSNYIGPATSSAAFLATTLTLANTSSQGPVQLGLTTVCPGGAPGPCVGAAGQGVTNFSGPTWTGVSGVSISGAGGFGSGTCPANNPGDCLFFGTSAAAPHAAACDALVRDAIADPNSAVGPITNRLAGTADFVFPGTANAVGAGLLNCFDAVGPPEARCIANQNVPTDPGVCSVNSFISIDNGSFDPNGDPISISQNPAPPYGLGPNLITLTVTETSPGALSDSCTGAITVVDITPPEITAPDDIVAECTAPEGTPVEDLGTPITSDICDADVEVTNDAPALFPLGDTVVTWTATDDSGNTNSASQTVTIEDTTPPDLVLSVTPDVLWPPNHKMVAIEVEITVNDICDPNPLIRLVSITSNEPDDDIGDGQTVNDIQGAMLGEDDREFELRAERSGTGTGRIYTITYEAEDASGNTTQAQATVIVPMSQNN